MGQGASPTTLPGLSGVPSGDAWPSGSSGGKLLSTVRRRLCRLGLTVWFYDPAGQVLPEAGAGSEQDGLQASGFGVQEQPQQPTPKPEVRGPKPLLSPQPHDFCRQIRAAYGQCPAGMPALARRVCGEGKGEIVTGDTGCCLLAVPLHQRRRLLGAAVACLVTFEMPGTEEFARACSRGRLDRQAMTALARQAARHSQAEAPWLHQVLEWLVQDEQAQDSAREELANLSTNLANTYEELALLYRISGSIKITQNATEFFQNLCAELLEVMQLDSAAAILYPRRHGGGTEQVVCSGRMPLTGEQLIQVADRYLCPRLTGASKAVIDNQFSTRAAGLGLAVGQVHTLIAVPLASADHSKGLLLGINKRGGSAAPAAAGVAKAGAPAGRPAGEFDSADLKLISSIGGQAAVFLENHHLYEDLQDLLMGMLHALTASIDAKDPYTCGHSRRVALISRRLSELCGFDDRRAGRIYLAGLLHDIGKIGMPEAVLRKAGRLTDDEFNSVKRHPEVGATILGGIAQVEDVIPAILHHHERVDGKGYPRGLKGRDVPFEALIVGLADSFDAMTSCRTYRASMPLEAVMAEVRRCRGTQFDGRLVDLLLGLDLRAFLDQLRMAGEQQPGGQASGVGLQASGTANGVRAVPEVRSPKSDAASAPEARSPKPGAET